jgi:uncharacterized protein
MEINTVSSRDYQVIESYGSQGFRVSGQRFAGPILVLPRRTVAWPVSDPASIVIDSLAGVVDEDPRVEVMLLGTGARMIMLDGALRAGLRQAYGFSLEMMDTGAACRTYNVLLAEGRPVAAALFPVER